MAARRARGAIAALCLLASVAGLGAQERPTLRAGARIRIAVRTPIGRQSVLGALLFLDRDSLTIVPRLADPRTYALRDISRFEVSRGRSSVLVFGIPALGAALGAAIVSASSTTDPACDIPGYEDSSCGWETPPGVVGAGAGFILSAIAVRLLLPERWQDVEPTALLISAAGRLAFRMGFRLRP